MKVIIREEIKMGSGSDIDVYKYDPNKKDIVQLQECIDTEADWFKKVNMDIEEEKVFDDTAHIFGGDYSIYYFIREVKKKEM